MLASLSLSFALCFEDAFFEDPQTAKHKKKEVSQIQNNLCSGMYIWGNANMLQT